MSIVEGTNFEVLLCDESTDSSAAVLDNAATSGLQGTAFADASLLFNAMIAAKAGGAHLFLSYTSNLISSGLRECFSQLVQAGLVDAMVTSAGGVEEDFIKCLGPTAVGDFGLKGEALRRSGFNRVGNLLIPNDNYVHFESFFVPVLSRVHKQQEENGLRIGTSPHEIITAIGKEMLELSRRDPAAVPQGVSGSLYCACAEHGVPAFCPALTDGSIGDMMFFYNVKSPGLIVDPLLDAERLEEMFRCLPKTSQVGLVVLGGGMPKHHLLRAAQAAADDTTLSVLMISTGSEADGSVSSSCVRDDCSQQLLRPRGHVARLQLEATLVFPLLVARALQHLFH